MNQTIRNLLLLFPAGKQAYLAYDSFTRGDADALGYTESKGPLGLARLRLPWTTIGGDFDISGGVVVGGDAQANIVVNGDFANWTLDDPDNWTVPVEDADHEISEVGPGAGHGGAGVGLCNLYCNAAGATTMRQDDILTTNRLYRVRLTVDTVISGGARIQCGNDVMTIYTIPGAKDDIFCATAEDLLVVRNVALTDLTFDDVSILECHAEYIDPGVADVVYRAELTTPAAGTDPAGLILRRNGATQWLVQMTPGTAGTDFELIELDNGTPTVRASADRDFAINTTYRIAVALTGQSIIVYEDGVQRLSYATGTVGQTNTQFGIWDSAAGNFRFNNAEITEYARYPHAGGY